MSAREKLLDTAASLAAAHGVTALGVERVVKEAGLSKGAFFYHFATKEEMVRSLLDHVAKLRMTEVETVVSRGARFTDAVVDMLINETTQNGPLVHVLIASVAIDQTLRTSLSARSAEWRRRMIDEDVLTSEQADLIQLAMDGLMISSVLYHGESAKIQRARANALRALASSTR